MACWATLRVVEANAQLGVTCRLRGGPSSGSLRTIHTAESLLALLLTGVPLIDGGTIRLPALIGLSRATDLMLTGRTISGTEAFAMGLSNHLSAPGHALSDAIELAKLLASHPQTCLRNDLRSASSATFGGGCVPDLEGIGRYNVQGGEAEKMRVEYELGMRSLASREYMVALGEFFDAAGAKRRKSNL